MDDIFSDDDEFSAFRDRLYDVPEYDEKENRFLTLPRQDLFIRGLEAPSNEKNPYTKYTEREAKVERQLGTTFVNNYSFFGLQKDNVVWNAQKDVPKESPISNRRELLEKLKREEEEAEIRKSSFDEEAETEDKENSSPKTPKRKSSQLREANFDYDSPKLVVQKKRRRVALSSSSDSDSDAEILIRSPRRKRVSSFKH